MKVIYLGTTAVSQPGTGARAGESLRAVRRILATLRLWRQRNRERAQFALLDDRMLRDIGVNRTDVWRETSKPFWRE